MAVQHRLINQFKYLLIRVILPPVLKRIFSLFPETGDTLLVIKNDGVGDYILFRNYLCFLRDSEKFRGYRICVLANPATRDLATWLDSSTIAAFYWYADSYFLQWRLIGLLIKLNRLRPETIFYTNYSRKYAVDWLVKNISADKKIAVDGDCINESFTLKTKANQYYTRLLSVSSGKFLHEFERNRLIVETLTGEICGLRRPDLSKEIPGIKPENNVVIFLGASSADKKWPASCFNQLCRRVLSGLDVRVVVVGGKNENNSLEIACEGLAPDRISCPEVDLIGLCALIGSSRLLISGDTVAVHMAAALDIPVVCISKGDLYGRFVPYPPAVPSKIKTILPDGFIPAGENYNRYSTFSTSDVSVERVCLAVEEMLSTMFVKK